jgi:hypothetical protein
VAEQPNLGCKSHRLTPQPEEGPSITALISYPSNCGPAQPNSTYFSQPASPEVGSVKLATVNQNKLSFRELWNSASEHLSEHTEDRGCSFIWPPWARQVSTP